MARKPKPKVAEPQWSFCWGLTHPGSISRPPRHCGNQARRGYVTCHSHRDREEMALTLGAEPYLRKPKEAA
jgi:hypothetical protein